MSYNWQSASTPQGRERLKELYDGLQGNDFIIVALSYKQGDRHLQNIFLGREYFGMSDLDRFLNDPVPIKEFLDPDPPQPKPLTIEDMRAYCIKWCEGFGLHNRERLSIGDNIKVKHCFPLSSSQNKWWEIKVRFSDMTIDVTKGMNDGDTIYAYALIRAIERGDLGQGKEGGV